MIHLLIQDRLQEAARQVLPEANVSSLLVRPCPDPKFGDYQCNALIAVAKERKMNPRQLAADVLAKLEVSQWCEKTELAGAGTYGAIHEVTSPDDNLQAVFQYLVKS